MSDYSGSVTLTIKTVWKVSALELSGKPSAKKVLAALRSRAYYDIMDEETLEILSCTEIELEEDPKEE